MLSGGIEAAFGGALLTPFRHDAGGMGLVAQRDSQHLRGRRHRQVQRQVDARHQTVNIAIRDMAAILATIDWKSVESGKSGSVCVVVGGRGFIKNNEQEGMLQS